jgi:hypothetical protein
LSNFDCVCAENTEAGLALDEHEACVNVVAHSTDLPFKPAYICLLDYEEYVKLLTLIKTSWP